MAKTAKKISVNKFESMVIKQEPVVITTGEQDDVEIIVTPTIGLESMIDFVNYVVNSCVDMDRGEYIPEAYSLSFDMALLTHYANFTMPSSLEKAYELINNTDAVTLVSANVDGGQLSEIMDAIDNKIGHLLDVIASSAVTRINEVMGKINSIVEMSESALSGLNPDDIKGFFDRVSAISDKDVETVARAVSTNIVSDDGDVVTIKKG